MKKSLVIILLVQILFSGCKNDNRSSNDYILWYDRPASEWIEALPVGNGRLGGMLFGDPSFGRLQVNEESLWGGVNVPNNNPGALANLPGIS